MFLDVLAGYGGILKRLSGEEGQTQGDGASKRQAVSYDVFLSQDDVADLIRIVVVVSYKRKS